MKTNRKKVLLLILVIGMILTAILLMRELIIPDTMDSGGLEGVAKTYAIFVMLSLLIAEIEWLFDTLYYYSEVTQKTRKKNKIYALSFVLSVAMILLPPILPIYIIWRAISIVSNL